MSYETVLGKSIVPSADLADIAADVNVVYPNGIGKSKGMLVYEDTGSILVLRMAQGNAADDIWSLVTETTTDDVTPS